jgi:hypothetical protein
VRGRFEEMSCRSREKSSGGREASSDGLLRAIPGNAPDSDGKLALLAT